jgi:hypothetical protein
MGAYYNQPTAVVDVPYSARLFDDIGPYNLSGSGSFPPGLNYNRYGLLTGTPTRHGSYTFTIKYSRYVGDPAPPVIGTWTIVVISGHLFRKSNGHLARSSISGHLLTGIAPVGSPSITTTALPDMTVGSAYSCSLTASGGATPYTWSVLSGAFPSGISLSSSGVISGTTSATPGNFSITIRCTGLDNLYATRVFALKLVAATSDIIFAITTDEYVNERNMLFVYDPAGYGYCASDGASGGYTPGGYFPYPGTSMPLGGGVVYYWQYPVNPVSPNGGRSITGYNATTGYSYNTWWTASSSPSGIFKFWVERTNGASMTPLGFRYRIWRNGSLFWERYGTGVAGYSASRRYSQLWSYNTFTGVVS